MRGAWGVREVASAARSLDGHIHTYGAWCRWRTQALSPSVPGFLASGEKAHGSVLRMQMERRDVVVEPVSDAGCAKVDEGNGIILSLLYPWMR